MSIEIGGTARELTEQSREREDKRAFLAEQRKQKRAGKTEIHKVERKVGQSRKQEAAAVHGVDHGPQKRWRPAYSLPSFPDPPGYSLCWIARHRRRHGDEAGLLSSLREGWEFVTTSEVGEEDLPTETFTGRLARYGEVIGDETTVLMKMPDEMKAQRDKHYHRKRDTATRAVTRRNPGLSEATPQMPLVEDRNEVSVNFERMRARRKREETEAEL